MDDRLDPNTRFDQALEDPKMREAIQRAIRWSKTFKDCWLKEMTGGKRHDKYPEWQASIDEMYEHGAKVEDVRQCFMDAKALAENASERNRA